MLPHAAQDTGEHPFHLHGHDFWSAAWANVCVHALPSVLTLAPCRVVSTSDSPGAAALYAHNYVRRDIVSVPAAGWARIRFVADNPGIWCAGRAPGAVCGGGRARLHAFRAQDASVSQMR